MAEDELRSENRESLSSRLLDMGEAALAIGAGAALFYRGGGARLLSDGLQKASLFTSHAYREITSRSMDDYSSKEINSLMNSFKQEWRNISKTVDEKNLDLNINGSKSLFGHFERLRELEINPKTKFSDMYYKEKISYPVLDHFDNVLSQVDEATRNNVRRFISKAPRYLDNDANLEKIMDELNLDDQGKHLAQQAINSMRYLANQTSKDDFIAEKTPIISKIIDEFTNIDELEKFYGSASLKRKEDKLMDWFLGDTPATIDDLLLNQGKVRNAAGSDALSFLKTIKDRLEEKSKEQAERFGQLTPDAIGLRKNSSGEIYSFKEANKFFDGILDKFAGTLPGTLLKARYGQYRRLAPTFELFSKSDIDPVLAAVTKSTNSQPGVLDSNYVRILNKTFKINNGSKNLEHIKELDDTYLMSGQYGSISTLLKQMNGDASHRMFDESTTSGRIEKMFDVFHDGEDTMLRNTLNRFRKFGDKEWRGNVLDFFLKPTAESKADVIEGAISKDRDVALDYFKKIEDLNQFFSKNTYELNNESVRKISDAMGGETGALLRRTMLRDEDMLESVFAASKSSVSSLDRYQNKDLVALSYKYLEDPVGAINKIAIKTDRSNFMDVGRETANFHDLLRMEIGKEAFMRYAHDNGNEALINLINNSGLSKESQKRTSRLASWALFQYNTGMSTRVERDALSDTDRMWDIIKKVESIFDLNATDFRTDFRKTVSNMAKETIAITESHTVRDSNFVNSAKYKEFVVMKKAIDPLDILKSMNDEEKFKATVKKFGKQFFAGRNNMEDVTTATFFPYFMLARLSKDLNRVGLGFSQESMGSFGSLAKNTALKRLAPVAFGYTYYNWLDDTVQELTGTGTTAAFANGMANLDLAYRKTSDTFMLTGLLKDEKELNPIMQYWFGKDEYQSYEERKKYYESGYDPVRRGRYWTFGGVNEFRGGQISYWEPNMVRRMNSDYYDKSLYDGYFDKWSHSLLPTPANPFSPIMGVLDPYWLEEKHYDDRPYAVSGSLFADGTPVGLLLNPTLGELIKPHKKMHIDRLEDGVDVHAIIQQMNQDVKKRALSENGQNLITLKNGKFTPELFTPFSAPSDDERVVSLNFNGNQQGSIITGTPGVYNNSIGIEDYDEYSQLTQQNPSQSYQPTVDPDKATLSFKDILLINAATSTPLSNYANNMVQDNLALSNIGSLNRAIISKAQNGEAQGVSIQDKLSFARADQSMMLLNDAETISELINQSTGYDMIKEAAITSRLITGIYGYGAHRMFGFGDTNQKMLATSADIDSPFRRFWDAGIGGLGGDTSEIARRFMPDFKRNARVNPLMNTMESWMPERFRFGDPYCVSEDTLIESNELEFIEAKNVSKNTNIITHKGKHVKVDNTAIRPIEDNEKVYKFKITSLDAIESKFSENHPILVCTKPEVTRMFLNDSTELYRRLKDNIFDIDMLRHNLIWKKAKNIRSNDYVAYPLPKYKEKIITIDLASLTNYACAGEYLYCTIFKNGKTLGQINRYITLTSELCYAVGFYLARGQTTDAGIKLTINTNEYNIANQCYEAFKKVCPYSIIDFKQTKNADTVEALISGRILSLLMNHLVGEHTNKQLNNVLWNLKNDCMLKLIEGYVSGTNADFAVNLDTTKIVIDSFNLILLMQIRKILLRFFIVCNIQQCNNEEKYSLVVYDGSKQSKTKNVMTDTFISGEYLFMKVIDKTECNDIKTVYGFQVNIDNSFCTAGLATHNTEIPNGEMRMPGKGYESLNELHPDMFGEYGAFDRFKILADIAPFSPEYKIWKQVASKSITDPKLKEEMKEIKSRVSQQSKQHEFYDYKFLGHGTELQEAIVTDVLNNGKFKIYGSDNVYKLAGVKLNKQEGIDSQGILSQHLGPGQKITIAVDENPNYVYNNDKQNTINAAVYVNGENLSEKLLDAGIASTRKGDTSAAATMAKFSDLQQIRGKAFEFAAHLDLPIIHDQWLRVRSPLESYKAEQVFGTPYQTWSRPIDSFLMPALERAVSDESLIRVAEVASYLHRLIDETDGVPRSVKRVADVAYLLSNRGAMAGAVTSYIIKPGSGSAMKYGARIGSSLTILGRLYTGIGDPVESAFSFALLGHDAAKLLKKSTAKGKMYGAAFGALMSASNTSMLNDREQWIPDRTREKWEMQDYFDRLNYIKFMGLYRKVADKAISEEGVDIENIINQEERKREERKKAEEDIAEALAKAQALPDSSKIKSALLDNLQKRKSALGNSKISFTGGEYTRSAILYKQAADTTMYGLKEDASFPDVIRALPKNDREYFIEFVKERDPEKREEIKSYSSPHLKRALQRMWGEEQDEIESNDTYFMDHNLPLFTWSGWEPNTDLADVQVKTIENEGMLLSDFGFYESQLRDPDVIDAPNLSPEGSQDPLTLQANLLATLRGLGLMGVDVSVEPSPSGIQVVANVARVAEYKLEKTVDGFFKYL